MDITQEKSLSLPHAAAWLRGTHRSTRAHTDCPLALRPARRERWVPRAAWNTSVAFFSNPIFLTFKTRGRGVSAHSLPFRHILLTGVPGCGKTTLLRKLAHALPRFRPAGFYTEEIRIQGQRKGFRLIGFDGSTSFLAHVDLRGGPRVGKYGVDVQAFENFLEVQKLDRVETPLVFIDEIGKMECLSPRFIELVRVLLRSPKTVVATVAFQGHGLITEVKQRPDVMLIGVDARNRDLLAGTLPRQIAALLES